MARTASTKTTKDTKAANNMTLAEALSIRPPESRFEVWLIGTQPLICHAWSEKARVEMLSKQVKASTGAKEARNPQDDFNSSLYHLPDGGYGFPVLAVKASWLGTADKTKGLARSGAVGAAASIWVDAPILAKQRTAFPGAVSDLPVVRIYGSDPVVREDHVKLAGKTASLAYRAQFTHWAVHVTGSFNPNVVSPIALITLMQEGGRGIGIGDWRPARNGMFGTYRVAQATEAEAWDKFAAGSGPMPMESFPQVMQAAE